VTLTASTTATDSSFSGYSGACSGNNCQLTLTNGASANVTATFASSLTGITNVNHIIIMLQENRSFDHYFGHLMDYWKANGYPQATDDSDFDGEPANASNLDPAGAPVQAFNLQSACQENPSPSWNESHGDRNLHDPTNPDDAPMDGFVHAAAGDAAGVGLYDVLGHRVMGYYNGDQLNYYYFMASNFATSDRWFAPIMTRTHDNRMYLYGATSLGHAYPLNQSNSPALSGSPTIFERLDDNKISWKIYVHQPANPCSTPGCLEGYSYLSQWQYAQTVLQNSPNNFQTTDQLMSDLQNGTLPQVAFIEPAGYVALDEHPTDSDAAGAPNVQNGALYVSGIINAFMKSPNWKDSVFIFTYDEPGGFYDHVPPQPAVPPDAIEYPTDLQNPSNSTQTFADTCLAQQPPYTFVQTSACGFFLTGFRVPLIVISPFTKKNYLSHTVMDYTAMLKFIETRFNLQPLTNRDAAQPDMTEFFDFVDAPWASPPTPPKQNTTNMSCVLETLNGVTIAPSPAPAGGTATVTLSLSHSAFENVTVQLSASPAGVVVPASEPIASGAQSASFTINVPNGITSLTVTGSIGGIPVSGTVAVQ
jgi:phospholipase C